MVILEVSIVFWSFYRFRGMLVILMNNVTFNSMSNFVNSQIIISAPINFISKIKKLIVTKHNSCHTIVFNSRQCKSLIIYGLL